MNYKHGKRHSKEYAAWCNMHQRCSNPANKHYANYGGRGISVHPRWDSFQEFYSDVGDCPAGMSLDRFPDNNGNYEPGNVRWASRTQQNQNKRGIRLIESGGRSMCIADWSRESGIGIGTIWARIKKGWDPSIAVIYPPVRERGNSRSGKPAYAFAAERGIELGEVA